MRLLKWLWRWQTIEHACLAAMVLLCFARDWSGTATMIGLAIYAHLHIPEDDA